MDKRLTTLLCFAASLALIGSATASGPAPERSAQHFEIRFMTSTIDHHLMGVEMADLCLEQATPPPPPTDADLQALCAQIAAAQTAEVQQLQAWLLQWYGIAYEGRERGNLKPLERLEGEQFDIAISIEFIDHHSVQIENSVKCLQRAFHTELLETCQSQIATQSEEILDFRAILTDHGVLTLH
jgi:uncharacterized protein (DUF305 family)